VISQLVVVVVVEAFDRRFLDHAVHPFDLAICPRVPDLGELMFDLMRAADPTSAGAHKDDRPAATACTAGARR
jgi:hypothetical protein